VVGRLALSLWSATQRCLVGRHPDCDVHLEHLSVSRHHAELTLDHAGHLFLTDLGAGGRAEKVSDDASRMLHVLGVPITSNVTHKNTCKFPMSIHLRRPRQPAMRVHAARSYGCSLSLSTWFRHCVLKQCTRCARSASNKCQRHVDSTQRATAAAARRCGEVRCIDKAVQASLFTVPKE